MTDILNSIYFDEDLHCQTPFAYSLLSLKGYRNMDYEQRSLNYIL